MPAKLRVLVDANVTLDVLAKREPHYATSAAVWALVEQGQLEGLLAAHTVTTLHYLVTKHLSRQQANLAMITLSLEIPKILRMNWFACCSLAISLLWFHSLILTLRKRNRQTNIVA
jgi:predicted nucleic acid-binding protein